MSFNSFMLQTDTEYNVTDIYSIQERYMSDQNKNLPEWITTSEAAEIMGIHIESVRRHCRKDDSPIKCKQFGTTWMILRDDAIAYAENKENFVGGRGKEGKL